MPVPLRKCGNLSCFESFEVSTRTLARAGTASRSQVRFRVTDLEIVPQA